MTSIIYNYYLRENALNYLSDSNERLFNRLRFATLVLIIWVASQDLTTVFGFADRTIGLLALVNLLALVMLMLLEMKVLANHENQHRKGIKSVFTSDDHNNL